MESPVTITLTIKDNVVMEIKYCSKTLKNNRKFNKLKNKLMQLVWKIEAKEDKKLQKQQKTTIPTTIGF